MTDRTAPNGAQLLARARAVLQDAALLDNPEHSGLVDDLTHAEAHFAQFGVPWPTDIHVGYVYHAHGGNQYAAFSHEALMAEIADYCREWWGDIDDHRDPEKLPDEEVAEIYFDRHDREWLSTDRFSIPDDASAAP